MRLIIAFLLSFQFICCYGQDLKHYERFFITKSEEFNGWLQYSNMGDILVFDSLQVQKDKVVIQLSVKGYNEFELGDKANYFNLNDTVIKYFKLSTADVLFNKLIFLMDLKKDQLEINIECKDAYIDIYPGENEAVMDIILKMGEISDGYTIPIHSIKNINPKLTTINPNTLKNIKQILLTNLKKHFKPYEAKFENYRFDAISQVGNELIIEISNVVNIVIPDENYFEHINVDFTFTPSDTTVIIDYEIQAKYGSGLIWAPKLSDYYDMIPKYQKELQQFSHKLKNTIDTILNNN